MTCIFSTLEKHIYLTKKFCFNFSAIELQCIDCFSQTCAWPQERCEI